MVLPLIAVVLIAAGAISGGTVRSPGDSASSRRSGREPRSLMRRPGASWTITARKFVRRRSMSSSRTMVPTSNELWSVYCCGGGVHPPQSSAGRRV